MPNWPCDNIVKTQKVKHSGLASVEKVLSSDRLAVLAVLDLHPRRRLRCIPGARLLRNNPFHVRLADHAEEIRASRDVLHIPDSVRLPREQFPKQRLSGQRQAPQVRARPARADRRRRSRTACGGASTRRTSDGRRVRDARSRRPGWRFARGVPGRLPLPVGRRF
jgi:hypothetical protein